MKSLKNISILILFLIMTFNILTIKSYAQNSYKARIYIDTPAANLDYRINQSLEVEGWIMTDDENATIKAYINGQEQTIKNITRKEREDVIKAITGYGTPEQNTKPGFILDIDTSSIKDGKYKLELKVLSSTGEILTTSERTITIEKYEAKSYMDSPTNTQIVKPDFQVEGWIMTNDENAIIKAYVDGQEQTIKNIIRKEREDVIKAITGYGGFEKNPKPGYEISLENNIFTEGQHILKVEVISREGKIISTSTNIINYENYKAKTYIDNPESGETTTYENNIIISGWLMSEDINSNIQVYIDGQEQTIKNITRKERDDVIKAISGYGGIEKNPKPGYEILLDISNINDGKHTLRLDIISSTGRVIESCSRNIETDKYKARGCIDLPVSMGQSKDTLSISGWVMSTDENLKIKIYINGNEQASEIERVEREDVIKAVSGYGGIEKNPTPGYKTGIDITEFLDGIYILRIEAISREGKTMYAEDKAIVIYNNYDFGIDVSYHNGTINWTQLKQAGVDFAIIRAGFRGYGQAGTLNVDSKFVENMKGAIANNINIGVYFYSQAITVEEAIAEADFTMNLLRENGFENSLTFPIVIDTEQSGGRADSLTKEQRTTIVKAFCERIKQYGYTSMIYSNKWWLEEKLDMNELSEYEVWLAHYTGTNDPVNNPSDYTGSYQIWQYTSTGNVYGISGNVDLSISYKKYI